jgi:iron complex outermembrane receptor protein
MLVPAYASRGEKVEMNHSNKTSRASWCGRASSLVIAAVALPVLSYAGAASAQSTAPAAAPEGVTLPEVVVQARRVTERLQDVPQAITALPKTAIADNHITGVFDIKSIVPNLFISKTATLGGGLMFIRGIQSQGLPNATLDTRVGIYVDGVYIARPEGVNSSKSDLAQIEVYKGPQGTLFGRNVTAGAINFITANPTGEAGGEIDGSYGNFEQRRYKVTLNTPDFKGLSLRATFSHDEQGGQIDNLAGGTKYGTATLHTGGVNYDQPSNAAVGKVDGHKNDAFFFAARYTGIDHLTADYKFEYANDYEFTSEIQNVGFFPGGTGCVGAGFYLGLPIDDCFGPGSLTQLSAFGTPVAAGLRNSPTVGALGYFKDGVLQHAAGDFAAVPNTPLSFSKLGAKSLDFSAGAVIRSRGHNLTLAYEVNPDLRFKSITAYRELTANGQIDTDGGYYTANANYFNNIAGTPALPPPFGAGKPVPSGAVYCFSCSYNRQASRQFSEELQMTGKWGTVADFIAGVYYFNEHTQGESYYAAQFAPGFTYFGAGVPPLVPGQPVNLIASGFKNGEYEHFASTSYAPFGHITFHVGDKIDLAAGARYTVDKKDDHVPTSFVTATPTQTVAQLANPSVEYKKFTWDATATYKFSPDVNLYARYATAYLAGGFFNATAYVPETSWSGEVGVKSEFLDRRVRLNGDVFYQSTNNSQDVGQTPAGGIYVANLPGTTINKGIELDASYLVFRGLTLNSSIGYTKVDHPCNAAVDATGTPTGKCYTRQQIAPAFTATISGQYDTPRFSNGMYFSFKAEGQYQSKYNNSNYAAFTPSFLLAIPGGRITPQGGDFTSLDLTPSALPGAAINTPGSPQYNYKALLDYLGYTKGGVSANDAFKKYTSDLAEATKGGDYWLVNLRASLMNIQAGSTRTKVSAYVNNAFDKTGPTNGSNYGGYFGRSFEQYRTYGVDVTMQF